MDLYLSISESKVVATTEPTTELFDDALGTAQMLIGATLAHLTPHGTISGIIVETEAYTEQDEASHSFRGRTTRNSVMYEPSGSIYIYFIYGMHYCLNFVCGPTGKGEAVLIRALQPLEGIELMKQNRMVDDERNLTNGPAKLVQALGIPQGYNGLLLDDSKISLTLPNQKVPITQTTRVGIRKAVELPWRFYQTGNPFVSKP